MHDRAYKRCNKLAGSQHILMPITLDTKEVPDVCCADGDALQVPVPKGEHVRRHRRAERGTSDRPHSLRSDVSAYRCVAII